MIQDFIVLFFGMILIYLLLLKMINAKITDEKGETMTKLNKPVKREISLPKIKRPIIVELDPEAKTITLREKGGRKGYSILIMALYTFLVRGEK